MALIERHADGSPTRFEARVAILDDGQVARQADLTVNQPLRYAGYSIYLSRAFALKRYFCIRQRQ